MEQRESIRLGVNIPAVAEFPGSEFLNCKITNYSAGGMFIQRDQTDTSKEVLPTLLDNSIGDVILLKTSHLSILVRIVRITDNGLGATYLLH